jgi:hypothetical protein
MYGVYLRLGVRVHASWRDVIRAASQKLRPAARANPALRDIRKAFYRQMLAYHANDQGLVAYWRLL